MRIVTYKQKFALENGWMILKNQIAGYNKKCANFLNKYVGNG